MPAKFPRPLPAPASAAWDESTTSPVVEAGRHRLCLLADRAVHDRTTRSLFVADVHLGKAATFRALGVPVPGGTTERSLERLDALLSATAAQALFVLGDLLHGRDAHRAAFTEAWTRWRDRHRAIDVVLVRGNHDRRAGDPPPGFGIDVVDPGHRIGDLRLLHDPHDAVTHADENADDRAVWSIAGHVHPVWRLANRIDALRLPCFWQRGRTLVLPAFGEFTGGWSVSRMPGDRIFVAGGQEVRAVP